MFAVLLLAVSLAGAPYVLSVLVLAPLALKEPAALPDVDPEREVPLEDGLVELALPYSEVESVLAGVEVCVELLLLGAEADADNDVSVVSVVALRLALVSVFVVLADVLELFTDVEEDESTTTGAVAVVLIVVVSAVLEDLVLLLQPPRANPARINVNKIEFFIGGLSCRVTDRSSSVRFERPTAPIGRIAAWADVAHSPEAGRGDRPPFPSC